MQLAGYLLLSLLLAFAGAFPHQETVSDELTDPVKEKTETLQVADVAVKEQAIIPEPATGAAKLLDLVPINGKNYFVSKKQKLRWIESLFFCHYFGMDLAVIDSEEENKAIVDYLKDIGKTEHMVYVGATRLGKDEFKWLNGKSMEYLNKIQDDDVNKNCAGIQNGEFKEDFCIMPGGNYFMCEQQ